jgi:hypothetical protein
MRVALQFLTVVMLGEIGAEVARGTTQVRRYEREMTS